MSPPPSSKKADDTAIDTVLPQTMSTTRFNVYVSVVLIILILLTIGSSFISFPNTPMMYLIFR
jgi:hypothetical protein